MSTSKNFRFNQTWNKNGEFWSTRVADRFEILIWKFGSIYQVKIIVDYLYAEFDKGKVGIGLQPGKTRAEAMKRGLEWVTNYQIQGPSTPEALINKAMVNFSDLFPTKEHVLEHFFLLIGCGYEWLDGALINLNQEEYKIEPDSLTLRINEALEKTIKIFEKNPGSEDLIKKIQELLKPKERPIRILNKLSSFNNLLSVPKDVLPDWKIVAEAARQVAIKYGSKEVIQQLKTLTI